MTQVLFDAVLEELVALIELERNNLPVAIFADRPACHDSFETLSSLFERDVHLLWFVADTSQVFQSLDGSPYAVMKSNLRKARDDEYLRRSITNEDPSQVIAEISPFVERESFTRDVVISGFKDRGIWPFNKELIIERAKKEFMKAKPTITTQSVAAIEAQDALLMVMGSKKKEKARTTKVCLLIVLIGLFSPIRLEESLRKTSSTRLTS
jgi:hypothetical protein